MTTIIAPDRINLDSTTMAAQALAGGWERTIPWPADQLGTYGDSTATGADVDHYVARTIGTAPGDAVDLGTGNPPGILSACPGRTRDGRPCIRLRVRVAA